jgi:succinate dehydrogenase hydrophobic anchor subunit
MAKIDAAVQPLRSIEVLEAEFEFLHGPLPAVEQNSQASDTVKLVPEASLSDSDLASKDRQRERELRRHIHGLKDRRSAICLSGGGVRSATFSLGVIQALAKQGWLEQFHYMSSVSGGGYVASWLSSWVARSEGETADVLSKIVGNHGHHQRDAPAEPAQVRALRKYSNYLSPVHGLSMDLITLVATFFRNLALHWTVLLPMLAIFIILPRLNLAVTGSMLNTVDWSLGGWVRSGFVILIGVIGISGFVNILRNLPGYSKTDESKTPFLPFCYSPIFIAAIVLSWMIPTLCRIIPKPVELKLSLFVLGGAVLLCTCKLLAVLFQGKALGTAKRFSGIIPLSIAGALSGLLLLGVIKLLLRIAMFKGEFRFDIDVALVYTVFCVPVLLAALWICMTLYVGLSHPNNTYEDEREWWARASAYIFWTIIAWLIVNCVVICAPFFALKFGQAKEVAGSATLLGLATGAYGYWSKNGSAIQRKLKSAASILGDRIFEVAAGIFLVFLATLISFVLAILAGTDFSDVGRTAAALSGHRPLHELYTTWTVEPQISKVGTILAALIALLAASSYFVGANTFSLHNMYGNRLVRAYMGASNMHRRPDPFTGFDPNDNCNMDDLRKGFDTKKPGERKLFHVVNIALNLVKPSSSRLDWQQRKAAAYTVSPLHAGAACTGFQPSARYTGEDGISLARAMTISGAAATPNMGYHTSALVAFAMTFFNIRLGWWLPNPGKAGNKCWNRKEPKWGMVALLMESFASTTDDNAYVYLSDGGHFENLGLYEMVRRRCHRIVVVDASCDPNYQFEDLENAVRKIRIDMGISIVFPNGLPPPNWSRGDLNKHQHSSVGTIRYSDIDGPDTDGVVVYIKPLLSGDEPLDITRYAAMTKKNQRNPFPHHPTSDQFFDEVRFESYRALGYHSVMCGSLFDRDARMGGRWPQPVAHAVDANESKIAAAEHNSEAASVGGEPSGVLHALGVAGVMGLSSVAIPAVAALGLAALVALGQVFKVSPERAGSTGRTGGPQEVRVTVDLNPLAFQDPLVARFTQLLEATAQLERSVAQANTESRTTVAEMHSLLKTEIELIKAARGKDRAPDTIVTLETLLKFKEALKKDPITWSDPVLGEISRTLNDTKKVLEREIAGKLSNIEVGVNRSNPRTSVRATEGGKQ